MGTWGATAAKAARLVLCVVLSCAAPAACAGPGPEARGERIVTLPASSVGVEAGVLRRQLARFMREHPGSRVVQQRTPDAADQRHQLYVQWLNARARDPDVLQLDVVWTPEFAAAGWLLPLERFAPDIADFFPAAIAANRFQGKLYALPWFIDVGMLYYRTDVLAAPPRTQAELVAEAERARRRGFAYGLVWQGARYEGLVTVFLEYLTAYGGAILGPDGRAALDSAEGHAALSAMRAAVASGIVPRAALGWQEEQARFAFQNGRALFMRNWPYAHALMQGGDSAVAGRFAVAAIPKAEGGRAAAALGGSQLAINAYTDEPEAAYAVIRYLLAPAQMIERARVAGQFPPRRSLFASGALDGALPMPAGQVEQILASAVARPTTPVYAELSDIVQIHVHRCLSGQESAGQALRSAAREIDALLARVGLLPSAGLGRSGERDG